MAGQQVCVVGAGIGGLCCGMLLAHRGFDVTVFEKNDHVGGRNAPLAVGEFKFDTGPTFLMMKFILEDMFREVGRSADEYMELVRLDPMYQLILDDARLLFNNDRRQMKAQIRRHFPGCEDGLDRFMEEEEVRFRYLFPCLQKPYSSWTSLLHPVLLKALPHLSLTRSVLDNVQEYFGEEKLAICFSFQSKYLGMSPWSCPAAFTILSFIEHAYGVYHVQGGLSEISESMAEVLREEGGRIRLNSPVERLLIEGDDVVGVRLEDGEQVRAGAVVIGADFGYAMSELVPEGMLRKWSPARLADRQWSCATFMMYLGVDKVYDVPHHNIIFASDYRTNLEDIFQRHALSEDLSLYVRNASVTDPNLAPAGKSGLYVLVPVPNNKSAIDWETEKGAFRERVLDKIAAAEPFGDLREHIEVEKILTPLDWERDYNVFLAAEFNLAHTVGQMMYFRPRNRFEELDNCYLVGGGTHPGSGVPTILESGRISANLICRQFGVSYEPPAPLDELL